MAGGVAFVLQLMLFREGLLVPIREVIWGLIGLSAILGLVLGVGRQRIGVVSRSSRKVEILVLEFAMLIQFHRLLPSSRCLRCQRRSSYRSAWTLPSTSSGECRSV